MGGEEEGREVGGEGDEEGRGEGREGGERGREGIGKEVEGSITL